MKSIIKEMNNETGKITNTALYTCDTKSALIAYIMQLKNNYNTWNYPKHIDGIFESKCLPNTFYFEDKERNIIIQSFNKI